MIITAQQKNIRQTSRKLRLVANSVKDLSLEQALRQLAVIERRATMPIMKVIKQAVANAVNNHGIAAQDLVLKDILVTEGPRYRRFNPVSRGRAHEIIKRTSHVTVRLETAAPAAPAPTETADIKTKETAAA